MTLVAQRAARMPITLVEGADFSIGLAITENGVAYPWAGATVVASILDTDGTPAAVTAWTFTPGVSGAAIMSLTDAQTTTLGVGTFRYSVEVTKAGITTPWLGGQLSILDSWNGGPSNSTATFSILTAPSVTLGIEVFGWGSAVLTADGNILTRAGGLPAEITRAALAADTAFTSRYALVVTPQQYGAIGNGVADDTTAIQAAVTAVSNAGGGRVHFPAGTYYTSAPIVIAGNNIKLTGVSAQVSKIAYNGTAGTAAITDNSAAVRYYFTIDDLFIQTNVNGTIAMKLTNTTKSVFRNVDFQSTGGTTGIGVEGAGAAGQSCYLNTFYDCNINGSLASVKLNNNIHGWKFFAGAIEGSGYSVHMPGTTATSDTCEWIGVAIQSTGANTSGVIIQLGTTGAQSFQASYNSFIGCRIETGGATTIVIEPNSLYNVFVGGSLANATVVDNVPFSARQARSLWLIHGSVQPLLAGPPILPGWLGSGSAAAQQTTSGVTELTILTTSAFDVGPNRRVRWSLMFSGYGTVALDQFALKIYSASGSTLIHTSHLQFPTPIGGNWLPTPVVATGFAIPATAAATTFVAKILRIAGTGTFTVDANASYSNHLTVEDCGPGP